MAQKIPFFELFSSVVLDWGLRSLLDGAYLTAVEVEREARVMHMALTVRRDMGEQKDALAAALAAAYRMERVSIHQSVAAPAKAPAKSGGGEVIMGAPIKGAVQPMAELNPKMPSHNRIHGLPCRILPRLQPVPPMYPVLHGSLSG